MPTPAESRAALQLVTTAAATAAQQVLGQLSGPGTVQRAALLEAVPGIVAYYADGTAALAADFYDDQREAAGIAGRFVTEPIVVDRTEELRRAVAWSSQPLIDGDGDAEARLAQVVQLETARPYRDTILTNQARDPEAAGWRRVTRPGGCRLCRMLADRGAVFKASTARFATHPNCNCAAQPVFDGQPGEEANVMQYVASKRRRTPAEREQLRKYLDREYGNIPHRTPPRAPSPARPASVVDEAEVEAATIAPAAPRQVVELSDDELEGELSSLMESGDFDSPRMEQLAYEIDKRDQLRQAANLAREEAEERAKWGNGWRRDGGSSERALRDEYETFVEVQYVTAEQELNGVLLSAEGRRAGIDPRDLFTRKRRSLKYASEELQEWFARNPRMSFPEFRAGAVQDDIGRAARQRSQSRGWESEFG